MEEGPKHTSTELHLCTRHEAHATHTLTQPSCQPQVLEHTDPTQASDKGQVTYPIKAGKWPGLT